MPETGPRILAIDVGAGTTDVLFTQPGEPLENAVKLVVPSRTRVVSAQIAAATSRGGTVVFAGETMGGGASTEAMKRHTVAGLRFVAGETAALSFADDLERVRTRGVEIVSDSEAAEMASAASGITTASGVAAASTRSAAEERITVVRSGDLDSAGLCAALRHLGMDPAFDAVAVAVQDHGFCPHRSNRAFRFSLWEKAVRERRPIGDLFYAAADVPIELTRLRAAAGLAAELAAEMLTTGLADGVLATDQAARMPVLVADTGPAALYGALPDGTDDAVLINVGNGHTVVAVALHGCLAGVFEHHTGRLDGPGLVDRLRRFMAGGLGNDEVRADGGHGAVLAAPPPADLPLIVTGPRRDMLSGSSLPLQFAAPHGDMMLTGCFGLLRALRDRGL